MQGIYFYRNAKIKLTTTIFLIWLVLSLLHLISVHFQALNFFSKFILLFSQSGTDLLIAFSAIKLFRKSSPKYKKLFIFLFVAFTLEAVTDANLNFTIYFFNQYPLSRFSELSIEIPFLIFQALLITCYLEILKVNDISLKIDPLFTLLPFFFLLIAILYFYVFINKWQIAFFSVTGCLQVIAVLMNLIIIIFSILTLITSKETSIGLFSMGLFTLAGVDIFDRFNISNAAYLNFPSFHMFWVLGLSLLLSGILTLNAKSLNNNQNLLYPIKSIKVQYALWFFFFGIIISLLILLLLVPFINKVIPNYNNLVKYTASLLIFLLFCLCHLVISFQIKCTPLLKR